MSMAISTLLTGRILAPLFHSYVLTTKQSHHKTLTTIVCVYVLSFSFVHLPISIAHRCFYDYSK